MNKLGDAAIAVGLDALRAALEDTFTGYEVDGGFRSLRLRDAIATLTQLVDSLEVMSAARYRTATCAHW